MGVPEGKYHMETAPQRLRSDFRIVGNQIGIIVRSTGNILSIYLNINSKFKNLSKYKFKSQHLAINPGQGPALKCAPGHDSMEDFNIITSD